MSYTTIRFVGKPRARHAGHPLNIGPIANSVPHRMQRRASSRVEAVAVLEDDKLSRPCAQKLATAGSDHDWVFDVERTKSHLVVRRLHVDHHLLLEDGFLSRRQKRRLVDVESDRVTDVMPAVVGDASVIRVL